MTYQTHRAFAVGWVMIGNIILYSKGLTEINYYLALIIMLQLGKCGALFPDVDHNWNNVKEKTMPNLIINKIIHLTGGKHRSWQTHSIDITAIFTVVAFILPNKLYEQQILTEVNREVLSIILIGFSMGWISHLFSDMLTSSGVYLFCFNKRKFALVPKKLFGIKFKTGEEWEQFVFSLTRILNMVIGIACLVYPVLQIHF